MMEEPTYYVEVFVRDNEFNRRSCGKYEVQKYEYFLSVNLPEDQSCNGLSIIRLIELEFSKG